MEQRELVIIGGGPAGLAAAISANKAGVKDILILERDTQLGGILNQCIHNGFGLHTFKEELTGPEYAARYIEMLADTGIEVRLETMVLTMDENKKLLVTNPQGQEEIQAQAIILAMGCRERPRGALNIPGGRPAGVYSAGSAQRLVNLDGILPGKKVVILGSGDIGLIMARRMTLEGAKVLAVAEVMPYSGGLKRNIVQCLEDFDIPLYLSTTVVEIEGNDRVQAVWLAEVDEKRQEVPGTRRRIECDTLLLSCGLLPENELSIQAGIRLNPMTKGPEVSAHLETTVPGIFACGNVLHVHDLVDFVSQEASKAGQEAANYLIYKEISVKTGRGIRYSVPTKLDLQAVKEGVLLRFRVADVYRQENLVLKVNGIEQKRLMKKVMAPGEMEQIMVKCPDLNQLESVSLEVCA